MNHPRTTRLALALTGLCALGAAARPAAAQELKYTLSGVTFSDNATASGFFEFNPTTQTFGPYDITTTDGMTGSLMGSQYTPGTQFSAPASLGNQNFDFFSASSPVSFSVLALTTGAPATDPGTFALLPPASGELTPGLGLRGVTSGSLVVTNAPVPEASTLVSFGLLLLGAGGLMVVAKRKKASAL